MSGPRPAAMRISTRLLRNAATSYGRLGTTFLLGIFMTWYLLGQVGAVGLGMVSLTMGSLGMSAVDAAIRQSVVRELAAALASGRPRRIERVLASSLVLCGVAGLALAAFFALLAAAAAAGFFNTPPDAPRLPVVLAWLFLAEGAAMGLRLAFAPFSQAIYAAQRVGVDNLMVVLDRLVGVAAALLAFGVLRRDGSVAEKLAVYAGLRVTIAAAELAVEVLLARRLTPALRWRRGAFGRAEFRAVAQTVWHTGQMTVLAASSPKFVMVLINLYFGLTFNAIWHVVIQVGGHLAMVAGGLLRGIDPLTTHLHEQGRQASVRNLMVQGIRYQLLAVLPFAVGYAMYLAPILRLWVGGRLAGDESLAAAGITVPSAISMIVVMGVVSLAAQVFRVSTAPLERMLFGMGLVRSYAWFAKYSALCAVGGAALLMALTGTPRVAPVPWAVATFAYSLVVIPRAAARHAGLSLAAALGRAVPRPVVVTLLLAAPLAAARPYLGGLSLPSLAALLAVGGGLWAVLAWRIGLEPGERARLVQMLRPGGTGTAARAEGEGAR